MLPIHFAEERARQNEREEWERFQQVATLAGAPISLDEARQFTEALERRNDYSP